MNPEKAQIFKKEGAWYLAKPRLLGFVHEDNAWEVFGPFEAPSGAYDELRTRFDRFASTEGSQTLSGPFRTTNYWGETERWRDT